MSDEKLKPPLASDRNIRAPSVSVICRFILLSIVLGVILHLLFALHDTLRYQDSASRIVNFDPFSILRHFEDLCRALWNMGSYALFWVLGWTLRYFLLGAVIVLPIWLIVRLIRAPKGR